MKYLNKFDSWTAYREDGSDKSAAGVTLVENEIIINPVSEAWFGDIVYFDKRDGKYKYSTKGAYQEGYRHIAQLVPIGVVAVPGKYTPDGVLRIVSLVNMSVKTPNSGTIADGSSNVETNKADMSMYWGGNGIDLGLKNYTTVNKVNPLTGEGTGTTDWMRIPGNIPSLSGYVDPVSGHKYYYKNYVNDPTVTDGEDRFGPSPFLADRSKNPAYFDSERATGDLNGAANSKVILEAVTEENWKTKSTLTNGYAAGNYPAAESCWRYMTDGTQQGQWYLPACGELAFLWAERDAINNSIIAIQSTGLARAYRLPTGGTTYGEWCWSSSECTSTLARHVYLVIGYVHHGGKSLTSANGRVRSFSALNPLKL